MEAWWEIYRSSHRMVGISAYHEDTLVALVPMVVDRTDTLRMLGYGASDYTDVLLDPEHLQLVPQLKEAIRQHDWHRFDLEHLHEDSPLLREAGLLDGFLEPELPAPNYQFGCHEQDIKLAKKKSLKRHYNYFRRNGEVEFCVLQKDEEVQPLLEDFFAQHIARRKLLGDESQFLDERQGDFYRALTRSLSAAGYLRFAVVRHHGRPIAYHFGFEYEKTLYWYKPTFLAALSQHSPGEVLLKLLIERCLEDGIRELDFTIGGESFKYRFSNHERHVYRLTGYRSSASSALHVLNRKARKLLSSTLTRVRND